MKFVLLIVCAFCARGYTQPNFPPHTADSLMRVWQDDDQPDTNRLKAIKMISYDGYLFKKPDSAYYYAQLHHDYASNLGLQKEVADALNTQGASWYIRGQGKKALEYYQKSLGIRKAINDKYGIGETLNNSGIIYKDQGNYDKAIACFNESLKIRQELGYLKGIAAVENNLGTIYSDKGDYLKAIESYKSSLKINEDLGNKMGQVNCLTNIGLIYQDQGNYAKAIEYHAKCLALEDETGYLHGKAATLSNIGIIHQYQDNHLIAKSYFEKSYEIRKQMNDKIGMASCMNNIGVNLQQSGDYAKALEYLLKSLKLKEEIGDKPEIASAYFNLGSVYEDLGLKYRALEYYQISLALEEEFENLGGISNVLNNIGLIHYSNQDYMKAIEVHQRGLELGKMVRAAEGIQTNSGGLYTVYKKLGRSKEALEMYELYISIRDSLASTENQKATIRQAFRYEYEKQATSDSIRAAEALKVKDAKLTAERAQNKQHALEAKQQEQQKYFLFGGLGLALLFGGFIFNRFRVASKQKGIIEEQKQKVDAAYDELEEKNTEILDSINYAKRIQNAILPPNKLVKEYLQSSFILYKPKDIVAGDFYWMEVVKESGNSTPSDSPEGGEPELPVDPKPLSKDIEEVGNTILFAAADCTGHVVPGAMVSVVCNNGLNRSVREHGLTDPGQILDKTREIVIAEFEKSEEEVKDGMDIALCSLSFAQSEKQSVSGSSISTDSIAQARSGSAEATGDTQTDSSHSALLKYAGAHNPLWIIRKTVSADTGDSFVLEEVKADKQPIGKYNEPKPYTTHTVELNPGDSFYIFSDGYADQFGGDKGKKLKAKNFKNLLLSIQNESMERQQELIDEAFESWKGTYEQLDDVCVIGVRV